jgi:hypothetical protein
MTEPKRSARIPPWAPPLLVALAGAGCGPTHGAKTSSARPRPSAVGIATGAASSAAVDLAGSSLSSPDGLLTLTVPPGALSATTLITIDIITSTAPGGAGTAYRLGPPGTLFSAPVTLVFAAPPGPPLGALAVATQDGIGYWLRFLDVARDDAGRTLTVTTTHFSDWAVVTASSARDLQGSFALTSTLDVLFQATGTATLNFAGEDPDRYYYLLWGSLALDGPTPLAVGTAACTPDPPAVAMRTNVAEALKSGTRFDWGASGHWDLSCTDAGSPTAPQLLGVAFDTVGLALLGCGRGYVGPPVVAADRVAGSYAISCASGALSASWDFTGP